MLFYSIAAEAWPARAIDWLNSNAGAAQALATVVLVAVTTWYALLTRQIVRATRASQRPYVSIDVSSDGGPLEIGIVNYGERAAEDVKFRVLQDLPDQKGFSIYDSTPIDRGIRYLPPGRGYWFMAFVSQSVYEAGGGSASVVDLSVSYAYGGVTYDDRVVVDLADLDGVLFKSFRDSGDKIARSLDSLSKQLTRRDDPILMLPKLTVACPICSELIGPDAKKCPQCQEWLRADAAREKVGAKRPRRLSWSESIRRWLERDGK